MRFFDLLIMSINNLRRRKLRTGLTVLGVVIGTASIVVMVSLGIGLKENTVESYASFGSLTRIQISSGYGNQSEDDYLVDATVTKLAKIPHVKSVSPILETDVNLKQGVYQGYSNIVGMPREELEQIPLAEGKLPDKNAATLEFIVGNMVSDNFYNSKTGKGSWDGEDLSKTQLKKIYRKNPIPGQPTNKKGKPYNYFVYNMIYVNVDDMEHVTEVQKAITDMGYEAYSSMQWLEQAQQQTDMIQAVLGGIGAVSLFVAAIGIANTMMMSIYERTKEIGVMKVLGCRMSSIGAMFLCEAAIIGLVGGIVGLAFSYGIGAVVNMVLGASGAYSSFRSVIPLWLCLVGLGFSTMVGVLAGLYPSQRAMRLSALAAIRTE